MTEITDVQSHYIQNEIDLLIDKINDKELAEELARIRDLIPCDCEVFNQ